MDNAEEKQTESQAEEDAEPLTQIVAEMPESDIPAYIGRLFNGFNGHLHVHTNFTMTFPREIDIFKTLKSKRSFNAHFWFKNDFFLARWWDIVQI